MHDVPGTAEQCRLILQRDLDPQNVQVVVLTGTGFAPSLDSDAVLVRTALASWGFPVPERPTL
jgi:hypothetical protein